MPRNIHLLVYNSPIFPAHWALWIPSTAKPDVGKIINAEGDAANGFEIAFERNFDLAASGRRHQVILLGQVLDEHVVDVEGDGSQSTDTTARDYMEQVALSVPAPGPSLISVSSQGPRQRVAIQNCQTWLREFVAALVQKGAMDQSALQILDGAPKN
ncbi:hypothetical protein DM02DRAFT_725567 [Periconia macrospinosa]|uniref:Uncharacterized protein n=1 Tax=Periconia macrospinosa TaxID=97972 RepID=A0A2V1E6I6_9PLEO|nr:hypothetical protein DM02DRAFT_725567 [Periconia macrospinosa]